MPKDRKRRKHHHHTHSHERDAKSMKRSRNEASATKNNRHATRSLSSQICDNKNKTNNSTTIDNSSNNNSITGICSSVSERYEKLSERIGQGTYGIVYKARDRQTQQLVALKKCLPHHVASDGVPLTTLREISILRVVANFNHDHIVRLLNVAVSHSSSNNNNVFLVFEYCEHELGQLIDAHYSRHHCSPFGHAAAKTLTRQLLSALDHLHAHHIIHRDVKLSNLLYTARGLLKVADFGLARSVAAQHMMTPNVASLWYRPPELLCSTYNTGDASSSSSIHYDQSIDIWAAACAYCEFMLGAPPMNGRNELEQLQKVIEFVGLPPADYMKTTTSNELQVLSTSPRTMLSRFSFLSIDGLRFLTGLLDYDPATRWTARQALDCPYLSNEEPLPLAVEQMPRFGAAKVTME